MNAESRLVYSSTTVADLMNDLPLSLPGSASVEMASEVITKHDLKALPVVENQRLIGLITPLHLLGQPAHRLISEVMTREIVSATPSLSPLEAGTLLTRQRFEVLPVTLNERLVGMISLTAVIAATDQQTDPLTGLPWSVALRPWATAALTRHNEVVIIFVDLDNFKRINTALGYVAGDALLRAMAYLLKGFVDASTDMLCRYGSDEFAIATARRGADVKALAHRIRETVCLSLRIRGDRTRLTTSLGVAGGRRIERRTPVHPAATIEDLLTLAHRAATEARASKRGVVYHGNGAERKTQQRNGRPQTPPEARLRLLSATIRDGASGATAFVELGLGMRRVIGMASGRIRGKAASFLLAEATLQATPQLIGQEHTFFLEDLREVTCEDGRLVVVVLVDGRTRSTRLVGAAQATDMETAPPQAVLDALNRRLARIAAQTLEQWDPPASERTLRSSPA